MEIWKSVPGYEGLYEVSNEGRVKSVDRITTHGTGNGTRVIHGRIMKASKSNTGYRTVRLTKDYKGKTTTIHSLVAIAFLGHTFNGLVVNHKNFLRHDNRLVNLEIISQRENSNQKHLKSTSDYIGVYWNKQGRRWHTQIRCKGKLLHLGFFICEHKAGEAYFKALAEIEKNGYICDTIIKQIREKNKTCQS